MAAIEPLKPAASSNAPVIFGLHPAARLPMYIRPFQPADTEAVVSLWQACGLTRPWNDPYRDIQRKLAEQPELFLVGDVDGVLMASAMLGTDGHRGWLYYLAVAPATSGAVMPGDWWRPPNSCSPSAAAPNCS